MLRDKRILVIEDEFLIALDIERTLQHAGAGAVDFAADIEEALGKIERGTWDAVITDANLQGRSIERIIAALRAERVPFLIVTGYRSSVLPKSAVGAPVLLKPFDPTELVAGIGDLCRRTSWRTR